MAAQRVDGRLRCIFFENNNHMQTPLLLIRFYAKRPPGLCAPAALHPHVEQTRSNGCGTRQTGPFPEKEIAVIISLAANCLCHIHVSFALAAKTGFIQYTRKRARCQVWRAKQFSSPVRRGIIPIAGHAPAGPKRCARAAGRPAEQKEKRPQGRIGKVSGQR